MTLSVTSLSTRVREAVCGDCRSQIYCTGKANTASPLCTQIYPLEIVALEFILIFIHICTYTTVHMSICKFTQVEYFTLVLRDPNTLFIVVCCLCVTIPISVVDSTKRQTKLHKCASLIVAIAWLEQAVILYIPAT